MLESRGWGVDAGEERLERRDCRGEACKWTLERRGWRVEAVEQRLVLKKWFCAGMVLWWGWGIPRDPNILFELYGLGTIWVL